MKEDRIEILHEPGELILKLFGRPSRNAHALLDRRTKRAIGRTPPGTIPALDSIVTGAVAYLCRSTSFCDSPFGRGLRDTVRAREASGYQVTHFTQDCSEMHVIIYFRPHAASLPSEQGLLHTTGLTC